VNSASAPSRWTPSVWLLRHAFGLACRHAAQAPQCLYGLSVTAAPAGQPATPSPTASMVPAISWPITRG
jgi:hypothetical protein